MLRGPVAGPLRVAVPRNDTRYGCSHQFVLVLRVSTLADCYRDYVSSRIIITPRKEETSERVIAGVRKKKRNYRCFLARVRRGSGK